MKNFKNAEELFDYAKNLARKRTSEKLMEGMLSTGSANIIYLTTYRSILNSLYKKLETGEITIDGKTLKREQ